MILNNIGQAFAGVGETDTAMKYFARCLKRSPHHPEANNTAGQIAKVKGNTEQAKNYFQNALKGGYHAEAIKGLREAVGSNFAQWLPMPGSPINVPFFNEFKYQLPRECTGPADAPYIKGEHEAFIKFIEGVATAYQTAGNDEQRKGQALLDKESAKLKASVMEALNSGKGFTSMPEMGSPINRAAIKKFSDLMMGGQVNEMPEHDRQIGRLKNVYDGLIRRYEEDKKKLAADFAQKRSVYNCGEGRGADCAAIDKLAKEECQLMVQLGNTAQSKITAAKLDIQQERLRYMPWQLNVTSYYGYLSGLNKHMARGAFYLAASKYLSNLA